jgi:hypothetical protein
MTEMENLKRKIEDREQLYIPKYVSGRVEDCVEYLTVGFDKRLEGYTIEQKVKEAFDRIKKVYYKRSKGRIYEIYIDQWDIIAYLRYYFFMNYSKIKWILLKNLEKGVEIIPRNDLIKIFDFGAGPGTASMAICDFLKEAKEEGFYENTKIELYFEEEIEYFSKSYKRMLESHEMVKSMEEEEIRNDESKYKNNFYDIIIISDVLNELNNEKQKWLIDISRRCLKEVGYLVIIEPAYKGMRKYIGDFLKNEGIRRSFKIVDASGPLCSEQNCNHWDKCYDKSVKRKKLRTPEGMTVEMKRFFEERKEGRIRWVYAVLKKVEGQKGFVYPSELKEYREGGGRIIKLRGWVIEKRSTGSAENITLCNGLGRCNLAFWIDRGEIFERVRDILEGDILCVEGELLVRPFHELPSISVMEIVEHKKQVD